MSAESDDKSPRNSQRPADAGSRLEDASRRIEQEIEELIRWFNDDAAPAIRSQSGRALRTASEKLAQFADYLDDLKRKK